MSAALLLACSRPCPEPRQPVAPSAPALVPVQASAMAAPSAAPAASREQIAILPLEDDELFRSERREVRSWLAREVAVRLVEHEVLDLAAVDRELAPRSKSGARCAWENEPLVTRAERQGWLPTEIRRVLGGRDQPEQLWVETEVVTLTAEWPKGAKRMEQYRAAFSKLEREPTAGVLGGLALSGRRQGQVRSGPITLCETTGFFECQPETSKFSDRAAELARCFDQQDAGSTELLFDGKSCEIVDLNDTSGPAGRLEACACAAVRQSAGLAAKPGRRRLSVDYEARELAGKPRPELRVIDVTTNLHAGEDWRSLKSPVWRLGVGNLDALAAPLARCALAPDAVVVAELTIGEAGNVQAARVLAGKVDAPCVEKALQRGAFACTSDGKPATLRIAIQSAPK